MLAQRLDFLMKVTNTQNSTLGRALAFDPSYIGRIRADKRGLPKNQPFIAPAAAFFARNICEDYQRTTVAEAVCPGRPLPEDKGEVQALLCAWLSDDAGADSRVDRLLTSLRGSPAPREHRAPDRLPAEQTRSYYYGNQGKRDAVEAFLGALCALDSPQTLLLCSDEDMGWLYEDAAFAARWAALLGELISKGCRIVIVHTVSREIGEMLEALQKWLPLYSSGAIEPYYCPKLRDNVYHRTLFVAKGHSALISNSVGARTQQALNILINDAAAVRALEAEFADYFSLCRPLVQIFGARSREEFRARLAEFEQTDGSLIAMHPAPSYFTMPADVAAVMAHGADGRGFVRAQDEAAARFRRALEKGLRVTELVALPDAERIAGGGVFVPMCDLLGQPGLRYTAATLRAHLENVARLVREYETYRVIVSARVADGVVLWAKEDVGAIMARSSPPTTVFGVSEPRMTAAFWEHLQRLAGKAPSREQMLARLTEYIRAL